MRLWRGSKGLICEIGINMFIYSYENNDRHIRSSNEKGKSKSR